MEIATSGILAGLAVALGLLASVMPVLKLFLQIGAAIPIAMIASRMRTRAGLSATLVAILMSAAVGGLPTAWTVAKTVLVGLLVGVLRRRGAGPLGAGAASLGVGAAGGAFTWGLFTVLAESRELALEATRTSMNGYLEFIGKSAALKPSAELARSWVDALIDHWWAWIPAASGLRLLLLFLAAHWLLGRVLARLDFAIDWDPLLGAGRKAGASSAGALGAGASPLPLRLRGASFAYPGAPSPALVGVDLEISSGFTAVEGPNGSGKSTLALLLAGAEPTSGAIERPGRAGLGEVGGTALVAQRSELQFLGTTVGEDLVWGLPPEEAGAVDVPSLLARVGLAGLEDAETRRLSGGQLQRLALAGALARRPALLVSDESTAMIDPAGRADLLEVLKSLAAEGTAVVHVTHDPAETASADRVVRLEGGRVVADSAAPAPVAPSIDEGGAAVRIEASAETRRSDSSRSPLPEAEGDAPRVCGPSHDSAAPSPLAPIRTSPASNPGARPRPRFGALRSEVGAASSSTGDEQSPPAETPPTFVGTPGTPRPVEHLWADRVGHAYDLGTPWEREVLSEISFFVSPGQAVLITGENGSGKSTLARILTGLMRPSRGKCTLGGRPMDLRVGDVALSRQFARLQLQRPSVGLDVLSAAGFGPSVGTSGGRRGPGLPPHEAEALISRALAEVGLDPALSRRGVDELSGGQQRRVALAGLLASDPAAIVLDEPLAELDAESRGILLAVLSARKRRGLGIVLISHDVEGLDPLCDERLRLAEGVLA